jgi:chromosome segregation ATPase
MSDPNSKIHAQIVWARERLDEMEATLGAVERKLSSLKAEAQAKVQRAASEMRAQRDAFKEAVNANRQAGEAAWRDLRAKLEAQWSKFETAFDNWAHATHDQVEHQKAVFSARVDAQIKALTAAVDQFNTSAKTFAAARKSEVDVAFKTAQAQVDAAKVKAEAMHQAGKEAWASVNKALADSRAAFDRASKTAHDTTGHAA